MTNTTLFHVTPDFNTALILKGGVDPLFSRCKENVIWLVERERITWALAHVSDRWKTPVSCIVVFELSVPISDLTRTRLLGVWKASRALPVLRAMPAHVYLE